MKSLFEKKGLILEAINEDMNFYRVFSKNSQILGTIKSTKKGIIEFSSDLNQEVIEFEEDKVAEAVKDLSDLIDLEIQVLDIKTVPLLKASVLVNGKKAKLKIEDKILDTNVFVCSISTYPFHDIEIKTNHFSFKRTISGE